MTTLAGMPAYAIPALFINNWYMPDFIFADFPHYSVKSKGSSGFAFYQKLYREAGRNRPYHVKKYPIAFVVFAHLYVFHKNLLYQYVINTFSFYFVLVMI